jgi:hypothetical protein
VFDENTAPFIPAADVGSNPATLSACTVPSPQIQLRRQKLKATRREWSADICDLIPEEQEANGNLS